MVKNFRYTSRYEFRNVRICCDAQSFHAIIIIGDNKYNTVGSDEVANKFGKQSANLAAIIRGFKAAVTRKAKLYNPDFEWQPLYHDHIIRTAESFENISNYIICNPENWENDRFFP